MKKTGLIIVDLQNDFLSNGALHIKDADKVLLPISRLLKMPFSVHVATCDWHPAFHCSFASSWNKKEGDTVVIGGVEQILWPDHCIQNTAGAKFVSALDVAHFDLVVQKGTDVATDSYSTFFDNKRARSTGLEAYLKAQDIQELYFAGLTTEYCVLYSVLDAIELGFTPYVILDACCGIDLQKGDIQRAIETMKEKGVQFLTVEEVAKRIQG